MKPLSLLRSEPMKAAGIVVSSSPAHYRDPASTMESDLLMYKQKTEQMMTLIRHYQNELESQKIRRDGVETVSRLLTESRQENAALKNQLAASQMIVKNLQNRVALSGLVPSAEDADNEVIIPGTSRQTLTNLALENKRLRSLLQQEHSADSSHDLQKTAEDTESRNSLEQTVEQLEAENHSMKRKLSDLENLFKSSNNDKDRQLLHYQDEIQHLTQQQSGETSRAAHQTVAGVSALKEHLRVLMEQCASFESHLENVQEPEPEAEKKGPAVELVPVSKQAVERTESVDGVDGVDARQLLEEKQQLLTRVDEVMQMNQRWREFSSERDKYTKTLEQQVQDLEEQLKQAMHKGSTPEINRHIEDVMEQSQKELKIVDDRRKKAEEEAARLRQEVAVRDAQLRQLQTQVTILTQTVRQHTSSDAKSVIEHLKAQIQVCTEDFEKERQDRQIALQKVNSLQEHIARLQKLNNHLQTLLGQTTRPVQEYGHIDIPRLPHHGGMSFGQTALAYDSPSFPSNDHENFRHSPDLHVETVRRDYLQRDPGPVSLPAATTTELLSPRGMHKPRHSVSDPALSSEGGQKDNFLTCPKCNKEFSEEHQGELLAHMDVCWE